MTGTRQMIQYSLALELAHQGETPVSGYQGAEPVVAMRAPESPASTEQLMEEVCDRENLVRAWKRVRQNKGSPGVDGMNIEQASHDEGLVKGTSKRLQLLRTPRRRQDTLVSAARSDAPHLGTGDAGLRSRAAS
jgi:hypothetical protein